MMPGPDLPVCYLLYVPRTGGRVVRHALESVFAHHEVCPATHHGDLVRLGDLARLPYRLYHGNLGRSTSVRIPDVVLFATLRDPIQRVRSHVAHIARTPQHPLHDVARREAPTLARFVQHPAGRLVTENLQTRLLAAAMPGEPDDELVDRALERLSACAWVGIHERLAESIDLLGHRMGWLLQPPEHGFPASPATHDELRSPMGEFDSGTRDLLAHVTRLDAIVYETARRRVDHELTAMIGELLSAESSRQLAARSSLLDGTIVLDAGDPWIGQGWWEPQWTHGRYTRWTGPGREATVLLPLQVPAGSLVEVAVAASLFTGAGSGPDGLDGIEITVNGTALDVQRRLGPGGAIVLCAPVPVATGPVTSLCIRTPAPIPWNASHRNGDEGRRGVAVTWIRLRPPGKQ